MKRASFLTLLVIILVTLTPSLRADDFKPHVRFDGQLFPSFIISMAGVKKHAGPQVRSLGSINDPPPATGEEGSEPSETPPVSEPIVIPTPVGDPNGLIGIELTAGKANQKVTVTVSCDEIMEPSTFTGTLKNKGEFYFVAPKIRYKYGQLAESTQATPVAIHFKVTIDKETSEDTLTATLRPINDCPLITIEHGEIMDTSATFAAYVNEQHPFLDKLLRESLDIGIVDSFSGYQGDEKEVIRQVYSIWDALVTRDIRYSSITSTTSSEETLICQHVRLIDESLNNSQANCVDGSVLLASALRRIEIEPFLIVVPGHCYMGFFLDEEKTIPLAIETTCLGAKPTDDELPPLSELLDESIDEDYRFEDSWGSFQLAIEKGTQSMLKDGEKFGSPEETKYLLIGIARARDNGVLPIAFRGKEEFVGNGLVWDEDEESDDEMLAEDDELTEEESEDAEEDASEEEMDEESDEGSDEDEDSDEDQESDDEDSDYESDDESEDE